MCGNYNNILMTNINNEWLINIGKNTSRYKEIRLPDIKDNLLNIHIKK